MRKPSSESSDLTLKMASAQVVETSVDNNSPSQDSNHPDDLFQSRYVLLMYYVFNVSRGDILLSSVNSVIVTGAVVLSACLGVFIQ